MIDLEKVVRSATRTPDHMPIHPEWPPITRAVYRATLEAVVRKGGYTLDKHMPSFVRMLNDQIKALDREES